MLPTTVKRQDEKNLIANELHSVWLLGIFWTAAHMGPFLCTLIVRSILENASDMFVLSYHLGKRHIVYILFYCYLGLSAAGFCCIVILRTIDLHVRKQDKSLEKLKWRIRFTLLAPFVLFLANSIVLASYLILLVENIAGNGYKVIGFWGCFLLAMAIFIFLVVIIMTISIFLVAAEAKRLKQVISKSVQIPNETFLHQVLWNMPSPSNNNLEWTMNNVRVPPPVAQTTRNNTTNNYNPPFSSYPSSLQGQHDSTFWSQPQVYGIHNFAKEEYIPDPARYL